MEMGAPFPLATVYNNLSTGRGHAAQPQGAPSLSSTACFCPCGQLTSSAAGLSLPAPHCPSPQPFRTLHWPEARAGSRPCSILKPKLESD